MWIHRGSTGAVSAETCQGREAEHTGCVISKNVLQAPPKGLDATVMALIAGFPTARVADRAHHYLSLNIRHSVKTWMGSREAAEREFATVFLKCDDYVRNSINSTDRSGAAVSVATVEQSNPDSYCVTIAFCGTNLALASIKNKLYAARRHSTHSSSENDRVAAAGARTPQDGHGPAAPRERNWATRGFGYFEMKPANVEQRDTIVTPVPQLTQLDAQQGDWILMLSASIVESLDCEETQQVVNTRLAKCDPHQHNTVVEDIINSSIQKGSYWHVHRGATRSRPRNAQRQASRRLADTRHRHLGIRRRRPKILQCVHRQPRLLCAGGRNASIAPKRQECLFSPRNDKREGSRTY